MRTRIGVAVGHRSASMSCWAARAAATASTADPNAAASPSPMVENTVPPCSATARRSSSSWRDRADRIASSSSCHSRVDPSMSVKRNVTVPDGPAIGPSSHAEVPGRCGCAENPAASNHKFSLGHPVRSEQRT